MVLLASAPVPGTAVGAGSGDEDDDARIQTIHAEHTRRGFRPG